MFWKKPKVTTPDQPAMNAMARTKEEKALIDDADFTLFTLAAPSPLGTGSHFCLITVEA